MKKLGLRFILAVVMLMTSAIFGVKINDIDTSPRSSESESIESSTARLMLRFYDGEVSLFEGNAILETFDEINFSTLPEGDRSRLIDGIELESLEDAYSLIEDFDG